MVLRSVDYHDPWLRPGVSRHTFSVPQLVRLSRALMDGGDEVLAYFDGSGANIARHDFSAVTVDEPGVEPLSHHVFA